MVKKGMVRIYEVYQGVAKPSNLYIDPETNLVVVKKKPKGGKADCPAK